MHEKVLCLVFKTKGGREGGRLVAGRHGSDGCENYGTHKKGLCIGFVCFFSRCVTQLKFSNMVYYMFRNLIAIEGTSSRDFGSYHVLLYHKIIIQSYHVIVQYYMYI